MCHAACHGTTGEGLVRGCSCSGTAGFAHLHCLARLARKMGSLWARWNTCQLCGQEYHGLVRCTLLCHLAMSYARASRIYGESHAICIEIRWRMAQGFYKRHLLHGYRDALMSSIESHVEYLRKSTFLLGIEHPTTLAIRASLKLCFEEQLDWTLDDIPRRIFENLDEIPRLPGHKVFGSNPSLWEASGM